MNDVATWRLSANAGKAQMIFAASLVLIIAAGVLAFEADAGVHASWFELAAGLMLMVGLSLIGWGLNVRH